MPERFLVGVPGKKENTRDFHLWTPKGGLDSVVWRSAVGGKPFTHIPMSGVLTPEGLYLGLSTGYVVRVNPEKPGVHDDFPEREGVKDDSSIRIDVFQYQGKVFDASNAGLYDTILEERLDDRPILYVSSEDGFCCYVPKIDGEENYPLVDLSTGKVILPNAVSSDFHRGSCVATQDEFAAIRGENPSKHLIVADIHTGDNKYSRKIVTSGFLFEHQGKACFVETDSNHETTIAEVYEETPGRVIFEVPKNSFISSQSYIASGEESGLLIALRYENGSSELVSHLKPKKPFLECDGPITIMPI